MKEETFFRTAIHLLIPIFLLYYVVPEDSWIGVDKRFVLILILLFILILETVRILTGRRIYGMRDYEVVGLPAYLWVGIGLTFAFLLFRWDFVAVSVVGVAWVDPLCRITRRRGGWLYPTIPLVVYLAIALSLMVIIFGKLSISLLILAFVATSTAIASERPNFRYVDDDFLMMIVPLVSTTLVYFLFQNL